MQSQGRLGEGGMEGLGWGVGAPQAAKQRVIHGVQTDTGLQERQEGQVNKKKLVIKSSKSEKAHKHISKTLLFFLLDYPKTFSFS